jgi:putative hydrolase of the HAD superfamily
MVEENIQDMSNLWKSVRVIFFDLDETLLDDDQCMREAVVRTCITLSRRYPQIDPMQLEETYLNISNQWWTNSGSVPQASGSGSSSGRDIRIEVWGKAILSCGLQHQNLAIEAADLYSDERRATYKPFPEVHDVLSNIRQKYNLGIISNGPISVQREKLQIIGLVHFFDVIVVSGELGIGKPEPGIFLKALELMEVAPKEALYVGDSLTSDVLGAQNVGMYAIWVNRGKVNKPQDAPTPELEISTLNDLIPLLNPLESYEYTNSE